MADILTPITAPDESKDEVRQPYLASKWVELVVKFILDTLSGQHKVACHKSRRSYGVKSLREVCASDPRTRVGR
jgi:hypothetical protein